MTTATDKNSTQGCPGPEKLRTIAWPAMLVLAGLVLAPIANAAEDHWSFGIGTGLSSLSLDGDVGFATESGGVVEDIDLDNGDTADMFESAFGAGGFANKGRWTIRLQYGTLTLEDDNSNYDAKWDRAFGELAVEYIFAKSGNHAFGVIAGINYYDHEWEFKDKATREKFKPDEDWTDGMIGLTHRVPFAKEWAWVNRIDYADGDSEGTFHARTGLAWQPFTHWVFNFALDYRDIEYGDEDDIADNDFYYYDVEETTINLGFLYVW